MNFKIPGIGGLKSFALSHLPGIEQQIAFKMEAMEDPENEGFCVPEGFEKLAYTVISVNQKIFISICGIRFDKATNAAVLSKPIKSFPLTQLENIL